MLIDTASGAQQVARVSGELDVDSLRTGDTVTLDSRIRMVTGIVPASRSQELVLERNSGYFLRRYLVASGAQIEQIRDAVELPLPAPRNFRALPFGATQRYIALRTTRKR